MEPSQLLQPDPVRAIDTADDGLGERLWLLVDLLEHEVFVATLLGGLRCPVDGGHGPLEWRAVDVREGHAPRPQVGDVTVLEKDDLVGVGQDRRDIGGQEALALAQAHHERDVLARADQPVPLAAMHDRDRIGSFEPPQGFAHGIGEIASVGLLHEVGDRLRIRLGGQRVPAGLQPVPKLAKVLDDPVVDDGDLTGTVLVRMGVEVIRPTMRRPTGMSQADGGVRRAIRDGRLQIHELAGTFLDE